MSAKRLVMTVGGTVLCALAIGYIMQNSAITGAATGTAAGPATGAETASAASVPAPLTDPGAVAAPVLDAAAAAGAGDGPALDLAAAVFTSAPPAGRGPQPRPLPAPLAPPEPDRVAAADAGAGNGAENGTENGAGAGAGAGACPVAMTARAVPVAAVALTIEAPCDAGARVTVHHNGMMFTETVGTDGRLEVTVPALAGRAVFIADLGGGRGAVTTARVPDLAEVERIVLQWSGNAGFELHALEFGAGYDDPGHVWYAAGGQGAAGQGTAGQDAAGQGAGARGWMVRLGDAGVPGARVADIYSFPRAAGGLAGTVRLSVEAEITTLNCGREISAQALELRGGGALRTREIALFMPDCSARGDFLVLNNLVEDLKIASR